jgi:hypothetical protein
VALMADAEQDAAGDEAALWIEGVVGKPSFSLS